MPFISKRARLQLTSEETVKLKNIAASRSEAATKIERAKMLLYYHEGKTVSEISRMLNTNRPKIDRCIEKGLNFGISTALRDLPRKGRLPRITMEARGWFLSLACMKPKKLGLASEYWTANALAKYIGAHCEQAGYPCLKKVGKGTVSKMLNKSDVKPHKIKYYLERTQYLLSQRSCNKNGFG